MVEMERRQEQDDLYMYCSGMCVENHCTKSTQMRKRHGSRELEEYCSTKGEVEKCISSTYALIQIIHLDS